jgi:acid phosphatase type 7
MTVTPKQPQRALCSWLHTLVIVLVGGLLAGASCASQQPAGAAEHAPPRVFVTFTHEDTSRAASVRAWSLRRLEAPALSVSREGAQKATRARAFEREVAGRYVYAFELTGLEPGARYLFTLDDGGQALGAPSAFRTLPADDSPLRVVTGGDLGVGEGARLFLARAAASDPDLVALGGDLAYANGRPSNVGRWDTMLRYLDEELRRPDGTRIPVVAAIGNHEVGGFLAGRPHKAPFWHALFSPLESDDAAGETYFRRRLGGRASLYVLDTGHVAPHGGAQAAWLEEALATDEAPLRFALYHVPLYPSVRSFDDAGSAAGRAHWLPLFDRYSLAVAFENHDHALKRTVPLRGGAPAAGGTLYVGDGAMGVWNLREPDPRRPYLARTAEAHHAWVMDLSARELRLSAVSAAGEVLDHVSLALSEKGQPEPGSGRLPASEVSP